jgi:Orsellinic acid/F9775 biosynthesis cluster protein D/Fungal specific transcription factor domain
MKYASGFDLADPKDVTLPKLDGDPVPDLTIISGLSCGVEECGHLCATAKRMKMHRAAEHSTVTGDGPQWRPVDLQTFFRGNQLRYFIVQQPAPMDSQGSQVGTSSIEAETASTGLSTPSQCPLACEPQLTADLDFRLLEHFQACTCHEVGYDVASREVWHTDVPVLAAKHPFLMHGILACAALHLAFGNLRERRRYKLIAAHHQSMALPSFRSEIANPSEDNCFALLAFTQLLIIHCFAADHHNEDLLIVGGKDDIDLPEWLFVIRGSCHIFQAVLPYLTKGSFMSLVTGGVGREDIEPQDVSPEMSDVDEHLRGLIDMMHLSVEKSKEKGKFRASALPSAVLILARAFSKARAAQLRNSYTMWIAIHTWPVQVPEGYLDLLKERDPAALVVLAHYCILLRPLEDNWYMHGYTSRLLSRIYTQLDEEWYTWLQWPLEIIGFPDDAH